jgi:hypothetical protein
VKGIDMTTIHWYLWLCEDGVQPDFEDMDRLVQCVKEYPNAELMKAMDSEGDNFLVLISGDKSEAAITKALDGD